MHVINIESILRYTIIISIKLQLDYNIFGT